MKNAFWLIFIIALGIGGIFLISLFGNITTTNQQDYTLIKNATEASILDSIDIASYRSGFYVCPKDSAKAIVNTKNYVFDNPSDYEILLNTDENIKLINNESSRYANCSLMKNQIKINSDVFTEIFLKRFSNNINNSKSYTITIKEIIEFPPKVSVNVASHNSYNNDDVNVYTFTEEDFDIVNRIDSILEVYN